MTERETEKIIIVMLTCKDYPSVTFGDRSRLSARSVLLPVAKVSTGHPPPSQGEPCLIMLFIKDTSLSSRSFVNRTISASLSLTREVSRRYAVTERENKEQYCKINGIIIWLLLSHFQLQVR